jgi:hypothetical protein
MAINTIADEVEAAQPAVRKLTPERHEVASALEDWLRAASPSYEQLQAMIEQQHEHELWSPMVSALMEECHTVVGINLTWLVGLLTSELAYRDAETTAAEENVAPQLERDGSVAETVDPWVAAVALSGSRQHRVEALARAIVPWLRDYRDEYGRDWHDLVHGSVAHTSSTLWRHITAEASRRGATIKDDFFKDAIKQAFSWLSAEQTAEAASQAQETPGEPAAAESALEVAVWAAVKETGLSAQELRDAVNKANRSALQKLQQRMPVLYNRKDFDAIVNNVAARKAASDAVQRSVDAAAEYHAAQPEPVRVAGDRERQLEDWAMRLLTLKGQLVLWGNLTGHHLATGECDRGLHRMLQITERELALLRGETVPADPAA